MIGKVQLFQARITSNGSSYISWDVVDFLTADSQILEFTALNDFGDLPISLFICTGWPGPNVESPQAIAGCHSGADDLAAVKLGVARAELERYERCRRANSCFELISQSALELADVA